MSRPGIEPTVRGEHARKEPFEQVVNIPTSAWVTWIYMNTHELHQDVDRIALASRSTLNIEISYLEVRIFTVKQDKVIFILN